MSDRHAVADFCIEIDFEKGSEAPSRVFRTISELIDAFYAFDLDLVGCIDPKIQPVLLLEDIEAGSVRTWLQYILKEIDDDALKKLEWRPAVGKYLVKAKYFLIDFLKGRTSITDRSELEALGGGLLKLAEETDVKHMLAYTPIPHGKLIANLERITNATSNLLPTDRFNYVTRDDSLSFNLDFTLVPEAIEDLLTKEKIVSTMEMILKVKKPDYLGESMWEFKHENRTIPAKITDREWLHAFQNRKIDVRPQDSIRARVSVITKYGHDFEVVATAYEVIKIKEVIPFQPPDQGGLF